MTETHQIPLFPLGLVLLPDMLLPLHIFEERYKQMVTECLAEERSFGIVLFDGQAIHPVGCLARISEVLERYDDGRMDIMTKGGARFVIRELVEDKAYMEARVLFFDDDKEANGDDLAAVIDHALNLLREVVDTDIGFEPAELGGHIENDAIQVPGLGRRAAVRDPADISFMLIETTPHN